MRFLHTSDWHLGQNLIAKSRETEHRSFLDWLLGVLDDEAVDLLLVSGDVFDTGTPANYALEAYYTFLRRVSETHCTAVVVVGGNHDSPATLHAPRQLLAAFGVHVIGSVAPDGAAEILTPRTPTGDPLAVVCAIPYLRDRDVRRPEPGESYSDKRRGLVQGIRRFYDSAARAGCAARSAFGGQSAPLLATGHLYAAGSTRTEGERDITVGSLGEIPRDCFPDTLDYVALGHLHQAQRVGDSDRIRYSGSPIPLSFGEAGSVKSVVIGDWAGGRLSIRAVEVPCFQRLVCVRGDVASLAGQFACLPSISSESLPVWAEVQLESDTLIPDVHGAIGELAAGRAVEVLAIRYARHPGEVGLSGSGPGETLDDLSPTEVFEKRLHTAEIPPERRQELAAAFREVVDTVHRQEDRP